MSAQTDEINLILFSVVKDYAIRLAFADSVLDVAPKMRLGWDSRLQPVSGLVVGPFLSQGIPGNFRFT